MATFYFNGAVDGEWTELGNWWMDDQFSVQATALPTSADDVIASASITSNSGSAPTVANARFDESWLVFNDIPIIVTGNCVFDGGAYNWTSGVITGDCTFNGSFNAGAVTGDCTFSDGSYNDYSGAITGDCTFSGSANVGTITGGCTFNDGSWNQGTVTGDCTFNNSSNGHTIVAGFVIGDCTFNDSYNGPGSDVNGNCIFNGNSANGGSVNNAVFNDSVTLYWTDGVDIYPGRVAGNCTLTLASALLTLDGWGYQIGGASFGWSDRIEGTIEIKYDKGINGSSILGVV